MIGTQSRWRIFDFMNLHKTHRISGVPERLQQPQMAVYEAFLAAGEDHFACNDIHLPVTDGGHISQVHST